LLGAQRNHFFNITIIFNLVATALIGQLIVFVLIKIKGSHITSQFTRAFGDKAASVLVIGIVELATYLF